MILCNKYNNKTICCDVTTFVLRFFFVQYFIYNFLLFGMQLGNSSIHSSLGVPKRIPPEADQITTQTFAVAVQASNLYRWVTANIR